MNTGTIVVAVLTLLAGIGVFLVACSMMSANLEAAGSNKLKELFSKTSDNKWLGVGIGALGTAAIQSSGATTVMVIGFVNVGILTLQQAATIIFGANIGTTITGQIVALGMFGKGTLSTTVIFSAFAGVGAFLMTFAKKQKWKTIGGILAGFGMLFIGLNMMSSSMESFAEDAAVINFLAGINNIFLLVLIGVLLTAIVQSSSVVTSVAITMVVAGLISIDQGIYLTMGSNIGSCVVALIASMSGGVNAKRTAGIHLIFNTIGVILFLIIIWLITIISRGNLTMGEVFVSLFPSAPQLQLAMFHTVFNIFTVLAMLPFVNVLVNVVEHIIPDAKEDDEHAAKLKYLDDNMLRTPVIAVDQLKKEILYMSSLAMENFFRSLYMIKELDYSERDIFDKRESKINFMNNELVRFIVQLSGQTLGRRDRVYLNTSLRTIADLERIGDYAENIVEYAENLSKENDKLTPKAIEEVNELGGYVDKLYEQVLDAYTNTNEQALDKAEEIEDKIDDFTEYMAEQHSKRLTAGDCTPNAGAQYLELCSDVERVADHLINVAESIKKIA